MTWSCRSGIGDLSLRSKIFSKRFKSLTAKLVPLTIKIMNARGTEKATLSIMQRRDHNSESGWSGRLWMWNSDWVTQFKAFRSVEQQRTRKGDRYRSASYHFFSFRHSFLPKLRITMKYWGNFFFIFFTSRSERAAGCRSQRPWVPSSTMLLRIHGL